MQDFAKGFYSSGAWKNCRAAYAKSKHNLCEVCLKRGIYRPGEIVHHKVAITPDNISDPSVTLNWDNLQVVCRDCHAKAHDKVVRRYKLDELGRVQICGE